MLENIKSHYITQLAFSLINLKTRYNLVLYNKSLRNTLNINSLYFKNLSTKYVIYGKNRIAREYRVYNDALIFEGEYFNGKRNGKGKEYYFVNGNLIFEGEYLNGKRNGKGKEYDHYGGKLKFEGEYLNDKQWIGKIYDDNGKIVHELNNKKDGLNNKEYQEREYLNGERNGKGKEYNFDNKIIFEGEYINGERWKGKETIYKENKLIF